MQKITCLIFGSLLISLIAQAGWASTSMGRVPLLLDQTYDQDLQWQASADRAVTPVRVVRWMMGTRGENVSEPSNIEFQPIVRSHNGQSVYIAALAYKF